MPAARYTRRRKRPRSGFAALARGLFFVVVGLSLLGGIAGGLARLGQVLPAAVHTDWSARAAVAHAALMIGGFLGTVIGIERAMAVKRRSAFVAPMASGLGGLCLLFGNPALAAQLLVLAGVAFVLVNVVVVTRQRAAHTVLLLIAALAWLTGNVLSATAAGSAAVLPWWFAFLVMTIAAERLEMTRLMRRRPGAQASLYAVLAALLAGAALSAFAAVPGGLLYGVALSLLAVWLGVYDIAWHTVRAQGLSRYMAICLLGGYAWLAVAGVAWAATALGLPARDLALHALGLGFVFSMIMGHAPVILPAVARVKLQFGAAFYVPLALLHLSLVVRLGVGLIDAPMRSLGASLNAAAVALFAATVVGAAVAWRVAHRVPH